MIYKSNFDGQWHKINPNYMTYDAEQNRIRRDAFKSGVFRVGKDERSDTYHLYVKNYSIGAWSPGDTKRARMFIHSAFGTYYALKRYK